MEDLINETWEDRDYRKTMSKINAKSLGALRQKLRKYIREQFEEDVAKFRENPDAEDEPEEQVGFFLMNCLLLSQDDSFLSFFLAFTSKAPISCSRQYESSCKLSYILW